MTRHSWQLATWIALGSAWILPAGSVRAADPLDDMDGTEEWDQVAPEAGPESRPRAQDDFKAEMAAWETIRQLWEAERERYIEERTRHKRAASAPRVLPEQASPGRPAAPDADIHDSNYEAATEDDGDWGDGAGGSLFAPARSLERAIDSELGESGREPRPAPAPRPSPAVPPPPPGGDELPSAFRQDAPPPPRLDPAAERALREDEARIRAEAEAREAREAEARRQAEQAARLRAEEDARLRAEEDRRLAEEAARRREAEEAARKAREAEEGAAAAARLLQEQAERERKEQEALRQKAALEEDEDGQVVDPEIKKALGEDEDD
jgi:hypothetical protein